MNLGLNYVTVLSTGELLRNVQENDRDALFAICFSTGKTTEKIKSQDRFREMLGDVYVGPYLKCSSDYSYSLVKPEDSMVIGYIIATPDTEKFERNLNEKWWPKTADKYRNLDLTDEEQDLLTLMAKPVITPPEIYERFPSHLHINILDEYQGKSRGVQMMDYVMNHLAQTGSHGIHLRMNARNDRAYKFYSKLGFDVFNKSKNEWIMVKSL